MKLPEYLAQHEISTKTFAGFMDTTEEAVRLWIVGQRIPRKNFMEDIARVTGGAVQPNDFYDISETEKQTVDAIGD